MNIENPNTSNEVPRDAASGRNGPSVTLIGLGLVVLLFVVFFLQNSEQVTIDFLIFEKKTTIRWSLLVAVVLGILSDRVFAIWWRRRRRRNNV
ncbi:MAG: hypothetical protein QOJ08_2535 [Ilumatobacteraceae bacterium]|jgi:uncharacterized integral membrane protein